MTMLATHGYCAEQPKIFYQSWNPSKVPQGVVVIAHGLGGHGGQFKNAAIAWLEARFVSYALDFRGHGHSEGVRGYIQRWSDYLEDLKHLLNVVQQTHPNLPIFLWGHSLGGLISLDFALQDGSALSGLLLTAPAVGKTSVAPLKLWVGRLLSWVWPTFSLDAGFDHRACCRDPEVAARYVADPIRHQRGTARLSTEFQVAQDRILAQVSELQVPLLLMHGGGDRITSPASSVAFFEKLTKGDHRFIQYPHAYHELHLDINQEQVLEDMQTWMVEHL